MAVAALLVGALDGCGGSDPRADSLRPDGQPVAATRTVEVEVSADAVWDQRFGDDRGTVVQTLTRRLGEPDLTEGPTRFSRIAGLAGWFEVAGDNLSPAWAYEYAGRTCWGELCLVFGGAWADDLRLRGWELARVDAHPPADPSYDVRLAGSGIGLGDTWAEVHDAYPGTVVDGGEGASLTIRDLPWPGFTDGVGAWRLTGTWDFEHPHRAPADAVLIRISAGEGPEPGCC